MNIKVKITLALGFLFSVILLLGGLGAYYLHQVSGEAREVLKDNYETLEYVRNMRSEINKRQWKAKNRTVFEKNLSLQEKNVTELGEREATLKLREVFNKIILAPDSISWNDLGETLSNIEEINMQAIVRKNTMAQETAERVKNYMIFISAFCALITFTFILNFPGYIANPVKQLTQGIREIANQNYEQRLHFKSDDEFGELATSFNEMAQKLDEYEHSNLAKILFEKRRIETIINQMQDAIMGFDEKNNIIFTNPIASEILGLTPEILIGKYAPDVALKNDLLRNLLNRTNEEKPLKIYADNRESYFTRHNFDVLNGNQVIGKVIILKNITAFHDLDLAKTNFIATISHELKTPISSIKMSLKLLEDERIGNVNEEQKNLIINIKEDSERLLKITGELLDLSQVETGNIQLNFQSVNPKEIIDFAIQAVHFQAEQKHITLDVQLTEMLPNVTADMEKTAWVLVNFLSNAIRYSPEKGKIVVKSSILMNNQKSVEFSVQDFGKGILEKYQQKIFERYFQVPSNGGQGRTGTGLGLAISKEFIEAQQGNIGVESQIGEGSRFYFNLPT